jgi:tetratricopeptide (TPR) repeat protein
MRQAILILMLSIFSLSGFSQQRNVTQKIEPELSKTTNNELVRLSFEIQTLKNENQTLTTNLSELKKDYKEDLAEQKSDLIERLNIYVFFIGLILSIIACALNFFGKKAIKERVEEIIKNTAESYAELKTNEVLNAKITDDYTAKIIREKAEVEINKLLKELDEKGNCTIEDIRSKGDDVINSVWAAPPKLDKSIQHQGNSDEEIKQNQETVRADEFFNLAFNTKDPKIRIELYKDVLEIEPENKNALNNIGVAYNDIYHYQEAISYLSKAIELDVNYGLAYANRASSYNQLGQLDLALKDAEKAIKLNPNSEWAYSIKGNVLTKEKKYVEAERILTKAIEINPKSPEAYFNRAYFNEETKKYDDCIKDYIKSEELGMPDLALLYNNMAVYYRRVKQFDKAIESITKARQVNPDWPNIDGTMALIYADKGDDENFYKHLKIALDKGCQAWNYLNDYAFDRYKNSDKLKKLIEPYQRIYNA